MSELFAYEINEPETQTDPEQDTFDIGTEPTDPPAGGELPEAPEGQGEQPPAEEPGQEPAPDYTQTFARRVNEVSQNRVNSVIAGFGWKNPFTQQDIKTQADYETFLRMQEANEKGTDPIMAARVGEMESELQTLRREREDRELEADAQLGDVYRELRPMVLDLAQRANVSLNGAFSAILRQNFGNVVGKTAQQTQNQVVQQMQSAAAASPGSLGAGGENLKVDFDSMTDEEFDKQLRMALDGKLKKE